MEVIISENTKKYLYSKSKDFWISNNNKTIYQKGFLGKGEKPFLPVFFGLLGEKAFSIITKQSLNLTTIIGGDSGYDFIIKNNKINIKLSLTKNRNVAGYIKVKKYYNCDIFVFSKTNIDTNNLNKSGNIHVKFIGYLNKKDLTKENIKQGIDGKPMYVIQVKNLKPMNELIYG